MITSDLVTLRSLVEKQYFFTVPIYQRLYVWGDEQVKTLLDDLLTAFQTKQAIFYLGGMLVMEYQTTENGTYYELIDGQQRFTTLWMMSLVWRGALEPFLYRQANQTLHPRVTFAIRPEINEFFAKRISGMHAPLPANHQIVDALATIASYLADAAREIDLTAFTEFIYDNVQMVLTSVPADTDLNKLFEVINSRGVQLQHHEILKGKMLSYLQGDTAECERYARLWDACASMDDYVEKALREIAHVRVADLYTTKDETSGREELASAQVVLKALTQMQETPGQQSAISLVDILDGTDIEPQGTFQRRDQEEDESSYDVRSIISFPMLLQHVLRIWLHQHTQPDLPKILDKELLGLFEQHFFVEGVGREQVTSFIELLWEIRYCFDKYIIKWVMVGDEEQHLIYTLRVNQKVVGTKSYESLVRQQPTSNDGFALLQSMLYHSQQITTHYWLTPLLAYIHAHPGHADHYYTYLRHLDNHLLCGSDEAPLIQRSYAFVQEPWRTTVLDASLLEQHLGIAFPHYWFYKLEFILWYSRRATMNDPRWDAFRMTAKNSVEHISPQTPQSTDTNCVSDRWLNSFGNCALVARSINSEYGNLPFNEKRQRFLNRNATRLDSLKMALIYANTRWDDGLAEQHQREMIQLIKTYFGDHIQETTTPKNRLLHSAVPIPALPGERVPPTPITGAVASGDRHSETISITTYWEAFLQYLRAKKYSTRLPAPRDTAWINFGTPHRGLFYSVGFDSSFGHIFALFGIECLTRQDAYHAYFLTERDAIEAEMQQTLEWRDAGRWGYRIRAAMPANIYDPEDWGRQFAWLYDQLVRLRQSFGPRLDRVVAAYDSHNSPER